jgi:hypothetical protein
MPTQLKEKCFHDVKKALFLENKASDLSLKYNSRNKRVTVHLNSNEPFYIYYEKYKRREIMRDNPNTKWFKYVVKKIKKEINNPSYKESYIITLCEGYSVDDLDVTGINIHIKKILDLKSKMVFAYLTNKDMIKLKNKNSIKIYRHDNDSYIGIPEQLGYPKFKKSYAIPSNIPPSIQCTGRYQDPPCDNCRGDINWREHSFRFIQEQNGIYNRNVVYLFIFDTGIARHPSLMINEQRSRNFVPNNNNVVVETDWFDRNGHGTHVAGTVASFNHGIAVARIPQEQATVNQVISYKVLSDEGPGQSSWIINAQVAVIQFARIHRDATIVVNMSLGANGSTSNIMNNPSFFDFPDRIVVVCAAGNADQDVVRANFQPANTPGSIVVGNSARRVVRRCNSNHGQRIDLFAPGTNIQSTWLSGGFRCISGTSMAAPAVAGVATLILAFNIQRRTYRVKPDGRRIPIYDVNVHRRSVLAMLNCLSSTLSCTVPNAFSVPVNLCNQDPNMNNTTRRILNMNNVSPVLLNHILNNPNRCRI